MTANVSLSLLCVSAGFDLDQRQKIRSGKFKFSKQKTQIALIICLW